MPVEQAPSLPFEGFKWKWASVQPTESLNRPDLFLGVLRALAQNDGRPNSDQRFINDLRMVEQDVGVPNGPNLARSPSRNIIRNAGQYWKALGVLEARSGTIAVTTLGHRYARGEISSYEFAVHTVLNHTLPSSVYPAAERASWEAASIHIRPLLLILQVISILGTRDVSDGFLTEGELANVVQPLSGATQDPNRIASAIIDVRRGVLDLSDWPRTTTEDNDRRVSNEFLKFLWLHGILTEPSGTGDDRRYALATLLPGDVAELAAVPLEALSGASGVEAHVEPLVSTVERRRISRNVLERPGQREFRSRVLAAAQGHCLLTGTRTSQVLEAAHIRPVASQGSDAASNGLCLRSDIHVLFDSNKIRLHPEGSVSYAPLVRQDPAYASLPTDLILPSYASREAVAWRWAYY